MLSECFISTASKFFEALDSPESLACYLMLKNGELSQLVSKRTDPAHYNDSLTYYRACAAVDFLRKADIPTGIDTQKEALKSFYDSEARCCASNARLLPFVHSGPFGLEDERLRRFLRRVRREVALIVGSSPRELIPRFGPGGTFEDKGQYTTVPDKMSSRPTITGPLRCILPLWYPTAWSRGLVADHPHSSDPKIVRGNRFTTVPKDGTTDRGIAIEPSINVFYQLGLGRALRSRLRRSGIDLENGQSRHRHLARWASIEGHLSTIDLSSASDSICTALVRLVFSEDWHDLLCMMRSPRTLVQGKWWHLQKFSSMGNGFTFELETVIFLAVARSLCDDDASRRQICVYGDDIIVPKGIAPSLINALAFLGFKANSRKTFVDSAFRESCGGDFFLGANVRPHLLKDIPDEPHQWLSLANGILRVIEAFESRDHFRSPLPRHRISPVPKLRQLRKEIWHRLPVAARLRGPSILGDLVFNDEDPQSWVSKTEYSIRWVRAWSPISRPLKLSLWSSEVQLASALYGIPSSGVIPRDSVSGHKGKWVAFS